MPLPNVRTGTNPQGLFRTVVWKGIWRLEKFIQCIGKTARMPGQTGVNDTIITFYAYTRACIMCTPAHALCLSQGTAKLITWHGAVQKCPGTEFARLAARPSSFVQEAVRMIDFDNHSKSARAQNVSFEGTNFNLRLFVRVLLFIADVAAAAAH